MTEQRAGRGVVITGGAGGVGAAVTRRWLEAGASTLVIDHRESNLERLRAELPQELHPGLHTFTADITAEAGASAMVEQARRAFAQEPDTLLHLVGGFGMGPIESPEAPSLWERMLALNLHSVFYCYRAMIPALRARGGGWIVGLGSRAAESPGAQLAAYAASKAGLLALTKSLSAEVRDDGIHINLLLASTIDTPANREAMGEKKADTWVTPDDIADATFFLCSERARSCHGATLEVYNRA